LSLVFCSSACVLFTGGLSADCSVVGFFFFPFFFFAFFLPPPLRCTVPSCSRISAASRAFRFATTSSSDADTNARAYAENIGFGESGLRFVFGFAKALSGVQNKLSARAQA
jgi:hypothetical protein